jgi:hypothetical protein
MGKPTLRQFKPKELGGAIKIKVLDVGIPIVLAQKNLQGLMDKAGAKTTIGKLGAGTYGAYVPSLKTVILDKTLMNKETAHHEGAHALDHKNGWVSENKANPFKPNTSTSPDKEWQQVLVHRFNRYVTPSDSIKTYSALTRRVKPWYLGYMNGADERFADSYSQWRMNPGGFAKYAPTIASWFRANAKTL